MRSTVMVAVFALALATSASAVQNRQPMSALQLKTDIQSMQGKLQNLRLDIQKEMNKIRALREKMRPLEERMRQDYQKLQIMAIQKQPS